MNALRAPYEAHTSEVGFASEGSALRSMWRSHGLQPVGAPLVPMGTALRSALIKMILKIAPEVNPVRNSSRCDSKPSGALFLTG